MVLLSCSLHPDCRPNDPHLCDYHMNSEEKINKCDFRLGSTNLASLVFIMPADAAVDHNMKGHLDMFIWNYSEMIACGLWTIV